MTVLLAVAAMLVPAQASACDRECVHRVQARIVTEMRKRVVRPWRAWLNDLRWCESRHWGYTANTGNGFYGGYQFTLSTWQGVGGRGYPHRASPLEQDFRAVVLRKRSGTGQWPVCG